MADRELAIVFRVVNDQLVNGISQAENAVKNFATQSVAALDQVEERGENLRHVWKDLFEAFIGIEIVDVIKKIAEAANDAAEKLDIAANSARNFGHSFDPGAMEKWLEQFAASAAGGGFTLPDMRQGVQQFAAIGLDQNQVKRATADAANLAATFGFTYQEAVHIATEALTGHVEMLTRYGIISREAAKNIHTVEDAMRALEAASAGGAEKRAEGLAGAFGRLSNAINNLMVSFGGALIPYFTATANALDHLADAFNALPDWMKQAAAGISFFTLSLTALGLMLPAVKLSVEFVGNALALLAAPLRIAAAGFSLLVDTIIGPVVSAIGTLIAKFVALAVEGIEPAAQAILGFSMRTLVGTLGSALESVGASVLRFAAMLLAPLAPLAEGVVAFAAWAAAGIAAMVAPLLPILALIAALALIGLAIYEVVKHWDAFKSSAEAALKWVGDRITDFVNFVKQQFESIGQILRGVWDFMTGNRAQGLSEMQSGLHGVAAGWQAVGMAAFEAGKKGVDAVKGWLQSQAWFRAVENTIKNFFGGTTTKAPNIPTEQFNGEIPGKNGSKDATAKAAENALKNFDESTKNWLDAFQVRVNAAQAMVDASKARLDAYAATLPNGKPQNAQEEEHYQALLNEQLSAEKNLRQATLEQHQAQVEAASRYEQIAASISPHLKNHDQLMRQALDAARQHNDEAVRLWGTYQNLGATLAQIAATQRDIRNTSIEDQADRTVQQMRDEFDARANARAAQTEAINAARNRATIEAGGMLPKVQADEFNLQLLRIALAAAEDNEALMRHIAAVDADTAKRTGERADQDRATQANNAATAATNQRVAAENRLNEALSQLTLDINKQRSQLSQALDDLVKRLNIPGLNQNAQTGALTFSPMQFLLAAFEQTKAFADVMATVNQIVKVFAQLLDNLRPIIDLVLAAVRAVANVFIFLYDTVARILRLLGIHLQIINSLNNAYGNIPLIQITHNIPTLNELGQGKLNSPLSNTPIGYNSLQDIGNTHTTLLQSILGTLIAILAAEAMFGHGHGGGIFGFLGSLFGSHASAGSDSSSPLQGALNAINTIPTDSIAQGTQSALAADGSSTSGGLFTATYNALQNASPYIAAAIGTVLGSAVGGGSSMSTILGGVGSIVGTIFGGPVGGAIGGFVGGILGGLFGHHASAPKGNTQTTEFTAMLHQAADVHAWMNDLTSSASSMLKSITLAASSLVNASNNLNKAASNLALSGTGNTFFNTSMGGVHLSNDLDVRNLGKDLAETQLRRWRSTQFAVGRGNIG